MLKRITILLIILSGIITISSCMNTVPSTKYDIIYDLDGGSFTTDNELIETVNQGRYTLPIPVKEDDGYVYEFKYYVDEEGNEYRRIINVNKDLKLLAIYEKKIKEFTINLYDEQSNLLPEYPKVLTYEDSLVLPTLSKEHYEFKGWSEKNNDKVYIMLYNVTKDLDLYPVFEPVVYIIDYQYDEIFDLILTDDDFRYQYGEEFVLPVVEKQGYQYLGWQDEAGNIYKTITNLTSNITLTLVVKPITYKLNLELDGGLLDDELTSYDVTKTRLPIPYKDGYKFDGWYLDEAKTNKITSLNGFYQDLTLYAKWSLAPNNVNLTLELDGGQTVESYNRSYPFNELVHLPYVTKQGYAFIGYTKEENSSEYITSVRMNDDLTLYAKYISLDEIYQNTIGTEVSKHLDLPLIYDGTNLALSYQSADEAKLSNEGIANLSHKYDKVEFSLIITFMNHSLTVTKELTLKPVTYAPLTQGNSVFGYLYSGSMYHFGNVSFENMFNELSLNTLDCVYYGFATVDANGNLSLTKDLYNERMKVALKLREYGIRVILCIGSNPANFSTMASTDEGISKFTTQVIETVERYHFDGVDIDWEFPGVNTGRPVEVDRPNFTKLIKSLRLALNNACDKDATPYLLTAAIPSTSWGSARYEIRTLNAYLDYINMMSYDLNNTDIASHHTSLYTSQIAPAYKFSVKYGVDLFTSLGFPARKIIVGMAFYGKLYKNATELGKSATYSKNIVYTKIHKEMLTNSSYVDYFDDVAQASYLINKTTGEFVSYESPRSIKAKCQYASDTMVGGVMFWDYSEDTTFTLMKAINEAFNK